MGNLGTTKRANNLVRFRGVGGLHAPDSPRHEAVGSVWDDMVSTLRERLGSDLPLDDGIIAASLNEINRFVEPDARWQAAFDSTLGLWLALRGCDVEFALAPVVANGRVPD